MGTNNFNMLKYLSVAVIFFLLIFATGCNQGDEPTSALNNSPDGNLNQALAKNNVIHHVSLGGADICEALGLPTGCDANFSLTANMKADGSVKGQWQDTFAGGKEGIHVTIDCMNIMGNAAIVGGVIKHGTVGGVDVSGLYAMTAVVDNGTSANDTPDQLSFSIFPAGDVFGTEDCNDLTISDFPLFDLKHGQVKVK
ncbi:MAG: hypothetical protein AB7T22_14595 [Calditrichaceae bacterium]